MRLSKNPRGEKEAGLGFDQGFDRPIGGHQGCLPFTKSFRLEIR